MRTDEQLFQQAAHIIRNAYERINETNTYGFTPEPSLSNEYVKTYNHVCEIAIKYSDMDLLKELERNWKPKNSI